MEIKRERDKEERHNRYDNDKKRKIEIIQKEKGKRHGRKNEIRYKGRESEKEREREREGKRERERRKEREKEREREGKREREREREGKRERDIGRELGVKLYDQSPNLLNAMKS